MENPTQVTFVQSTSFFFEKCGYSYFISAVIDYWNKMDCSFICKKKKYDFD